MVSKDLLKHIRELRRLRWFAKRLEKHGIPCEYVEVFRRLEIHLRDISELFETRRNLRKALGSWNDHLHNVFGSCNIGVAIWREEHQPICIRYEAPIDEFPTLKNGCGFKDIMETVVTHRYVCNGAER